MGLSIKQLREQLEYEMKRSSKVFIVGHNSPDFDSIGACVGLQSLAANYGKKSFIIVDDDEMQIEPGVKRLINENKDKFQIIKRLDYLELVDDKSLVIVADVNKPDRISIGDSLDKVRTVIVIDHHNEDETSIKTNKKFISLEVSSASEVVARILISQKVRYPASVANFLLAGINLDTHRFKQNTTSKTHDVAEKLIDRGASIDYINSLFLEEFESYCRINNLIIFGTNIKKYSESLAPIQISFTLNRTNPRGIYLKEDFAKAADQMMKFNGIDASFVLGYVDEETVHISARGGKKVNVGEIMKAMHGGGNMCSAGTRIKTDDIGKVEEELMSKIGLGISSDEELIEEGQTVKQYRKRISKI